MLRASIAAVLLVLLGAPLLRADVVVLTNGDRVSGRVVGSVTRRVRLQTPYGVLVMPRNAVARIERADGAVEVVTAPPEPPAPPPPPPPPEPARLYLVVAGDAFWQAWDPKSAPSDASLRLELRLDDQPIATYTDETLDPEDLPKAVVNSFVFSPEKLAVGVGAGVVAGPPVVVPGEIGLPLKLPAELAGSHRLSLAYQLNAGSREAPRWQDVASAAAEIALRGGGATNARIRQSRGTMEYARRRMRNVETFAVQIFPAQDEAPATGGRCPGSLTPPSTGPRLGRWNP